MLMHLLLFIYPSLEKLTHHHEHEERESSSTGFLSFSTPEQDCAVCDFHFVNFVGTSSPQVNATSTGYAVVRPSSPEAACAALIRYFCLRAPPSGKLSSSRNSV